MIQLRLCLQAALQTAPVLPANQQTSYARAASGQAKVALPRTATTRGAVFQFTLPSVQKEFMNSAIGRLEEPPEDTAFQFIPTNRIVQLEGPA
jgi:hypothetical protein